MSAELFDIVSTAMRALDRAERVRTTFPGAPKVGYDEIQLDNFGWKLRRYYRATFEPEPIVTFTGFELLNGDRTFALPLTAIPGNDLAEMEGEMQVELMDRED